MLKYCLASDTLIGLANRLNATLKNSSTTLQACDSLKSCRLRSRPKSKSRHYLRPPASTRGQRLLPFPLTSGIIRVCFDLTGLFRNKDILLC